MRLLVAALAVAMLACPVAAQAPVEVMVVGTFHMSNPGRDMHNITVDDVLAPKRQAEIAAVTAALKRFKPTMVAVEWPADITTSRYGEYRARTLKPSRNEVVQLGFRLADEAGLASVEGIDVEGDFPYEALQAYAAAHGQTAVLDTANAEVQSGLARFETLLAGGSVGAALRYVNDLALIKEGNGFYRSMLRVGGGNVQPGADLLTAWYGRNFRICANLVQRARPGDRVVVFYGFGHSFLLRQCVAEMPGYKLVEANDYLPR